MDSRRQPHPPIFLLVNGKSLSWEPPNGDAKMVTDLVRKDGKLTGELKDLSGTNPVMPITKIEEDPGKKMTIYFDTAQAGEMWR